LSLLFLFSLEMLSLTIDCAVLSFRSLFRWKLIGIHHDLQKIGE